MNRSDIAKPILLTFSFGILLAGCAVSPGPQGERATSLTPNISSQSGEAISVRDTRLVSYVEDSQIFEIEQQLICSTDVDAEQSSVCPCSWVALSRVPVETSTAPEYDGQPCVVLQAESTQGLGGLSQPGVGGIAAGLGLLLLLGAAGGGGGGGSADGT